MTDWLQSFANISADCLILLSDDGLFSKNPKLFKNAKLISKIENIDDKIEKVSMKSGSEFELVV